MAQKYKVERVAALKEELKNYPSFVFANYRGLNVQQLSGLRKNLKEKGARFHVVKNRFVKRAFRELGFEDFDQFLIDPTALAYFDADLSEITKILMDSAKESTLEIKGGYAHERVLSPEDIERISELPSREALIAQVLGTLNAPVSGLVFVLQGLLTKFVRTLKEIESRKQS